MKNNTKIFQIVEKIVNNYDPEKILLFGSYAKGNADIDSDLDLIIIKNTKTPKHKRGREIRKYLYGSLLPIDLKVYTPDELENEINSNYSFLNSVIKDIKSLYERKN